MRFAQEVAQRNRLEIGWVRSTLAQAHFVPSVQKLMKPAPKFFVKNWTEYKKRYIEPLRIQAGVKFWRNNRAALERAEEIYGVPAQILVGVIGVETVFGSTMGNFRVLDTLATLAFDFPAEHSKAEARSAMFKTELEQFLIAQSRTLDDPSEHLGSFAGAVGLPQFMPSSINKYAIDFDGDGKIDLRKSASDSIGSVANYLRSFGWRTGMPTHYPVSFDKSKLDKDALMAPDILPTFSVAEFTAKGAVLKGQALDHQGPLALIELLNGYAEPAYVAGTENFYVITRYNWSSYYAMAVIELGERVEAAFRK